MPLADTIGTNWAWVIPALSASAFFIVAIVGRFLPGKGAFVSIAAIALGFVLFWYVFADLLSSGDAFFSIIGFPSETNITWGVTVDRLSVTMLGLVTFVALLVQLYSVSYMKGDPRFGWYFARTRFSSRRCLRWCWADNLVFLYVAWELVGLGSFLLIGFWYERRSAAEAAKKAFITTRIGDVGCSSNHSAVPATGSFEISTIFHVAQQGGIAQGTLTASMALIFLGAMGKSAQFPFHVWLPDAMEGPTPVSALIHAATMVAAGVYLVARLMPLFELAPLVLLGVGVVGLVTFLFAGTLALVMTDLKRVLAYSTISHLGLMMLSLGALSVAAAMLHLVAHGVSKALPLPRRRQCHARHREDRHSRDGRLVRVMPITAITFVIGAASLAGLVPLSGFFSKDEIMLAVLDHRHPVLLVAALAGSVLSAAYMARLALVVCFGRNRGEGAHESPWLMTLPLAVLALFALLLGLAAYGWSDSYTGFGGFLVGGGVHHAPALASGVVCVADPRGPGLRLAHLGTGESDAVRGAGQPAAAFAGEQVLRRRGIPVGDRQGSAGVQSIYRAVRPCGGQRHRRGRAGLVDNAFGREDAPRPDRPVVQLRLGHGAGRAGPFGAVVAGAGITQPRPRTKGRLWRAI